MEALELMGSILDAPIAQTHYAPPSCDLNRGDKVPEPIRASSEKHVDWLIHV